MHAVRLRRPGEVHEDIFDLTGAQNGNVAVKSAVKGGHREIDLARACLIDVGKTAAIRREDRIGHIDQFAVHAA